MDTPRSIPATLIRAARTYPLQIAAREKVDGHWRETTYRRFVDDVRALAAVLVDRGMQHGDRVAVLSANRPAWSLCDYAIQSVGAITVPLYATSTPKQIEQILRDSGARLVFVGGDAETAAVQGIAGGLDSLEQVVSMGSELSHLIAAAPAAESAASREAAARLDALTPDDLATIVYTSGTTGDPKGVMLSHGNLLHQLASIGKRFTVGPGDRSLCFLPLSHAFERASTFFMLSRGVTVSYLADPKSVADFLTDVRPTAMVAVPRVFEKVHAVATAKAHADARKAKIFDWALGVGRRYGGHLAAGRTPSVALRAQLAVADRLVLSKIRDAVGGPKRYFAAGGAALGKEIAEFFYAAGLLVCEGYGLTETSPVITCNTPREFRFGTVGKPIDDVHVRIGKDDEIQVRGPNVTRGYWNNQQATDDAFVDGWFRTGDVGHLDDDGFLVVTDRIKDLVVTAQGKNVAPQPIEALLTGDELIEHAMIIGERRPYLIALVQPSYDDLATYAVKQGWGELSPQEMASDDRVRQLLMSRVEAACATLPHWEQPRRIVITDEPLSITDGDLTPTLKIRRKAVGERYRSAIDETYAQQRG